MLRDGARLEACFNYGQVVGASGVGGLAGVSDSGEDTLADCANFARVCATGSSTYGAGGLVGRLSGAVTGCVNYGDVSSADRYTGGLVGYTAARHHSALTCSANYGAVLGSNPLPTAALGGLVGYAQYLTAQGAEQNGTVAAEGEFVSEQIGELWGREGEITLLEETAGAVPAYQAQPPRSFAAEEKDRFQVRFVADGALVAQVDYVPGDQTVTEPEVPEKPGYAGFWDRYQLGEKDLTVRAVYRQRLVRDGDRIDRDGTWFITWFSCGQITIGAGATVTLDGSNGGEAGFEGLSILLEPGANLTLRDTVLNGEDSLLICRGGNRLTLAGESRLLSRTDAADGSAPTVRVEGDLTIDGTGSLYLLAGLRNAAIAVTAPGSLVTLSGGTLSIYKDTLLGREGGAFYANGAQVLVTGGTLKGCTTSDNVAVISADGLSVTGGTLLLQAQKAPAVIQGPVTASGGTIAAYGHTGNSAGFDETYLGAAAIPEFQGSAAFTDLLPFTDLAVTDICYDAVANCWKNGLFNGTSETAFSPKASMTRAMFVTVLYRLAGQPTTEAKTPFQDLTQDWYRAAVSWAVAQGITQGFSQTAFSPDTPVTREQAAVFFYRYAQSRGETLAQQPLAARTYGALSPWAEGEALWALAGGLYAGAPDGLLTPTDDAPRSLLAVMTNNYLAQAQPAA